MLGSVYDYQRFFPTGSGSVAKLNADSNPDLVITNFGDDTVSVLPGNGDGTFSAQQTYSTASGPSSVAIAKLDGGSNEGLVVANSRDNTVSVLLGNVDGIFHSWRTYQAGVNPRWVAVMDLNNDNKLDIVTTNFNDDTVSVLLGNGDGTFGIPASYFFLDCDSIAVTDVNSDVFPDIVVTSDFGASVFEPCPVAVFLNKCDGTFTQQQQTSPAGAQAVGILPANLGTGITNLGVLNAGDNTVSELQRSTSTAYNGDIEIFDPPSTNTAILTVSATPSPSVHADTVVPTAFVRSPSGPQRFRKASTHLPTRQR